MPNKYLSKEANGSVIEIVAEDYSDAIVQYHRRGCSGELYHAINFERQPLKYRVKKYKFVANIKKIEPFFPEPKVA
tara:strand:+ start:701 stop:928 length:228 start_codon:yes stop_codon:yes gene_type:complete